MTPDDPQDHWNAVQISRPQLMGLPRGAFWAGTLAGIVLGLTCLLSPTTAVFLLAMPVLFLWACRGLGPRERRWVCGVLAVAVLARLAVLAGLFLLADRWAEPFSFLFPDERFIIYRSLWLLRLGLGGDLAPSDYSFALGEYGRSNLPIALALWQAWFGPAPYGVHLLSVAMWLVGAVALHRTARRAFGPMPALAGLVAVLFTPTLFAWSVSVLKEPAYFLCMAMTIAGAMAVVRAGRLHTRILAAALVAVALATIAPLRPIGLFVGAGGLAAATVAWVLTRRGWLCVGVLVMAAVAGSWAVRQPAVQAKLLTEARGAAQIHWGNVMTPGYAYKLLDPRAYTGMMNEFVNTLPADDAAHFVLRAAASFVTVPTPWTAASPSGLALIPQQVAWYILIPLVGLGAIGGWRRDSFFTWLLVCNAALGAGAVALFNGNVGTLVRMRDTVVTVLVWLGGLGACIVLEWMARRFSERIQHGHS